MHACRSTLEDPTAALLAAPILTAWWMPAGSAPALLTNNAPSLASDSGLALTRTPHVMAIAGRDSPARFDRANQLNQFLPWLVQIWAVGVLALSCRWVYGSHWVRRVRTVEIEPLETEWLLRLRELRARLGITRPVALLKSALVDVPMVVGWLRPVILLPAGALCGLTPGQLEAILVHELAHVRRYDYLVNWFQTLMETLMFYHPAVWWISRCIRVEREHCCDDLVVRVCGDKLLYARALVTLEEARGIPALAFAATGGSLLHRVRRLLGIAHDNRPPTAVEFGGIALVAIGCVFAFTGIWLFTRPSLYAADAVIRVSPALALQTSVGDATSSAAAGYFPFFLQTECLVIRSPAVLHPVLESLKSKPNQSRAMAPAPSETLGSLRARLVLRPIPNTSAIDIQATDPDPAQAARIANAVTAAYRQYRMDQSRSSADQALLSLNSQCADYEDRVARAQEQLDRLRVQLKIPGPIVAQDTPTVLLSAETLRHIEALRIESQAEYVKQQTLLERLEALDPKELPQTIPTIGIQDSLLSSDQEALQLVDQQVVSLQKELGPENTVLVKALAQQADLQQKIRNRTTGILAGLRAKASSTREGLLALSNAVAQAIETDKSWGKYYEAKRGLDDLLQFRSVLRTRLANDRARIPPQDAIEVLEDAVAPSQPLTSSRNRALNFFGLGLLLILLGGALTRAGRYRIPIVQPA